MNFKRFFKKKIEDYIKVKAMVRGSIAMSASFKAEKINYFKIVICLKLIYFITKRKHKFIEQNAFFQLEFKERWLKVKSDG